MRTKLRILMALLLLVSLVQIVAAQDDEAPDDDPAVTEEAAEEQTETTEDMTDEEQEQEVDLSSLSILDSDVEIAIEPTGDNGYCSICHNQPLRTTRLADGTILNLYVNPEMILASVHGPSEDSSGLGCLDCHGEDSFPHNDPEPESGRAYTIDMVSLCTSCHVTQGEDLTMGLHAQAISEGNLEAAVCTDCHGAHHIQSAESFPDLVAGVCGDCHENTYDEWIISDHADIGPLGCATCHDHHAQTLRVGETSTDLCINCHSEMPDFHAHNVHLEIENPIACADCHMYREDTTELISVMELDSTGHSMLMDTTPCTTCHEQLVESGEWDQIISDRYGASAAETTVDEVREPEEPEEEETDNTVSILQGLLVGLGLGVTFTIVFITRSLRN